MNKITLTRPRATHNIILFSIIIMLLLCMIVAYLASKTYTASLEDGKRNSDRLLRVMSDHVEQSLLAVDLSLRRAAEMQYLNELFGDNLPDYITSGFSAWIEETPQIAVMMLADEHGIIRVASHKKGYEHLDPTIRSLVDRHMLNTLQNMHDDSNLISIYETPGGQTRKLILLSRKLNKIDGRFAGMVVAAIDADYFLKFFTSVEPGGQNFMSVYKTDGTLLISGPQNTATNIGIAQARLSELSGKPNAQAFLTRIQNINDHLKISSSHEMDKLPIMVTVVLDDGSFLAEWRDARVKDIGFLGIFTIFVTTISVFTLAMSKQMARVQRSEQSAILASQAKSEFLANMSHELRTPLNAIIGFSEMISSGYFGPLNAKQKERIHDINLCGSHLLQLINDILEFSKGNAGKLELVEESVDLRDIIGESARMMDEKVRSKEVNLVVDLEPGLPLLWADKRKIRQIVLNLLSNAIKFTPKDGTVGLAARVDTGQQLRLVVSDTGIGIAAEDIPRALSAFGQVHRSHSHEGTGLGLPLCKMFTELHDGKLVMESTIGKGTIISVIFPASRVLPKR